MTRKKANRTKTQMARDRRRVAEMYLRGSLQVDIAEELGITQSMVSNDLKALHNEWIESALVDIDEKKGQELAKIDNLEIEYWKAWKKSQEDAEVQVTKRKGVIVNGKDNTIPVEGMRRVEGQSGNPSFLQGVQWCINKRCEILGLDAPRKMEGAGENGAIELLVRYADNKNA